MSGEFSVCWSSAIGNRSKRALETEGMAKSAISSSPGGSALVMVGKDSSERR